MNADNREGWERGVAALIEDCRRNKAEMRETVKFLAVELLAKDMLPRSGRIFLVDVLKTVVAGGNPFPRKPSRRRKHSHRDVLAAVLREAAKRGAVHGDFADIHARVGRRLNLRPSTVAKSASIMRSMIKKTVFNGRRDPKDVRLIAHYLSLPEATIKSYF
jgi:hypothetical protein